MILLARLFCFLALMAFAVGAVAHSAGSTAMASAMITADAGMDDCDACGDPEAGLKGAVCDFVCNVTGMAAVPVISADTGHVATSITHDRMPERVARSITGPPAKEPPRLHL